MADRSQFPQTRCVGPLGRREFLRVGLAGFAGLTMPDLLRLRVAASCAPGRERTSVILVWLHGGASHLETYDPKPNAPSEYRGPYSPISTKVPGIQICELLPHHAKIADKFVLLRSMVHSGFCHQQGTQQLLTGHPVLELKQKPDHPDFLAITNKLRFDANRKMPNYVGVPPAAYTGSAYLGPAYDSFDVGGDPNDPNFNVPNIGSTDKARLEKIGERIDLRKKLDQLRRDIDTAADMDAIDAFEQQAWNMLTSPEARKAFDINQESTETRDRYGRNRWGQQCLMARRLVEAGVELVTTQLSGPLCGRVGNWDDHAVNHNVFEGMKHRAPFFDQAVSALIEDIFARGLDRKVMVVVSGEFGRTPKISYAASTGKGIASAETGVVQPGRDHWPRATSILFAGGGITGGQVIGATDARGEDVTKRRVGRGDFLATLYRHLGVDAYTVAFRDFGGRPIPILQEGLPIAELTA
jgi:Protein of unknown function (DUF1501)